MWRFLCNGCFFDGPQRLEGTKFFCFKLMPQRTEGAKFFVLNLCHEGSKIFWRFGFFMTGLLVLGFATEEAPSH